MKTEQELESDQQPCGREARRGGTLVEEWKVGLSGHMTFELRSEMRNEDRRIRRKEQMQRPEKGLEMDRELGRCSERGRAGPGERMRSEGGVM